PGVTLRDYGGAGGLKTVSVRGFGASHTGVVYDGVVLSDVQDGQIDLSRYALDNVSSLTLAVGDNEDIFGPARLAASAATLSISSFVPNLGDDTPANTLVAQVKGGSFGYISPYLRLGHRWSDRSATMFAGEMTHTMNDYPFTLRNGDLVTREKRNNSRMNSGHVEVNHLWKPTSRSSLTAKVYWYDNSRQLPGPVIYYNNINNEHLRESNLFGQVSWRNAFNSRWSMQATAKGSWNRSLYHDRNGKYPGGVLDQNYYQREAYATASALWLPVDGLAVSYAADYAFNNLNSNLPTDTKPLRHSLLQSLTGRWRTSRVTLTARILHSLYLNGARAGSPMADARRFSPSASVSFKPIRGEELHLRASYKNIFRMPTFNEAYFDHYGSIELKPESTDQFNVGATWSPRPRAWLSDLLVTVDVYHNRVRDMIVAVPYNMFIWNMTNVGSVRVLGVDATATATFPIPAHGQDIVFSGNYSYQHASPRLPDGKGGRQLAYVPRHSGTGSVTWENPWVCVAMRLTAVSHRFTVSNNTPGSRMAGYAETGASLWHTFTLRGHELMLRGDAVNLLDKQYEVVARYPMPGRSFYLSLRFTL
ncbi:MAG: TonB-dependent receptor, partial [Duncaniella sp.]|nr:TonB-dependent receptor [Duncaniella sp.]